MVTELSDLIGKPFVYGARGPAEYDCWGLAMEVHWRWHGVHLPDQASSVNLKANADIVSRCLDSGDWAALQKPVPGSVIIMSVRSVGAHIGFVISPTKFIHAVEDQSVMIERLNHRMRVIGAYSYVGNVER